MYLFDTISVLHTVNEIVQSNQIILTQTYFLLKIKDSFAFVFIFKHSVPKYYQLCLGEFIYFFGFT